MAAAPSTSLVLSLSFLVLFSTICVNVEALSARASVNITNILESHQQLTVHCKSKDDDLGFHQLPPLISYAFDFRPNVWISTLFFCSFQWPGSFHYFEIYNQKRDEDLCTLCLWIVGEKGLCLYNSKTLKYDICYTWPSQRILKN
ncbi:S-protein homolog 5 [Momordica charantia]|uniref:S-protein homolog n=1 Tax=Momordica charantia TaxID=3673 RepID=A0A6J1CB24_MOMCH|nr:S-protein homolog 5 [Momordica charantia]